MALLDVYFYFKFFFTITSLTSSKDAFRFTVFLIVYNRHFITAIRAFYFLFSYIITYFAIASNIFSRLSISCSNVAWSILLADRLRHSFRMRFCSLLKCFRVSLSFSARMLTILPSGVSALRPHIKALNSSHFIALNTSEYILMPYCVWKLETIKSQSSNMS